VDEKGQLYGVSGGSGGYAETVFRHAARVLFNREIDSPIEFRTLRNSDFREAVLEVDDIIQCYLYTCLLLSFSIFISILI
jgi:hypothetical protein